MTPSPPPACTTGLPGLDNVLKGVLPGDNVVWQVERWEEYRDFVTPYAEAACAAGKRLIYFRFASHPELLPPEQCHLVHRPDPTLGFEAFVTSVHDVITDSGEGSVCVFDCLSELSDTWHADSMLGNFFMLTCPRLLEYQRLTYFALYRHAHSDLALTPIQETTQFMLDVFSHRDHLYIRPLKVQYRSGEVLNHIHMRIDDDFIPVECSAEIADVLRSSDWRGLLADPRPDRWKHLILSAREIVRSEHQGRPVDSQLKTSLYEDILQELIGDETRICDLARNVLHLEDLLSLCERLIGSGRIGGKAVGMVLARAIIREKHPGLISKLEAHDSFHVGSDIYYTFLIRNQVWWIRQRQREEDQFLEEIDEARERILHGEFPDYALTQFRELLSYLGESPFIVRSSSLLEDAYGNAFAGKYESVFCVNQGPPDARLQALLDAVREVYASTVSEEALRYRKRRGLLQRDEQMALLIQRVSGQRYDRYYYPQLAGVGLSYNPYVWHRDIDPEAGVLRLVFGLGTRAVDPAGDDHTRIIALNAPELRPTEAFEDTQRTMDALDLEQNKLISGKIDTLIAANPDLPRHLFISTPPGSDFPFVTFHGLLRDHELIDDLRQMLQTLEDAYGVPVDVEFCVNFIRNHEYRINLLQCRPFQIRNQDPELLQQEFRPQDYWIRAHGPLIGVGTCRRIHRILYVEADAYSRLSEQKQRAVARCIGDLNRITPADEPYLLIGPGRWGTREPSLGVPVRFGNITQALAVVELLIMHENLVPDASLGTHFLNELIECDILYAALSPGESGNTVRLDALSQQPSQLTRLLPGTETDIQQTLRVIEIPGLHLRADVFNQQLELFTV